MICQAPVRFHGPVAACRIDRMQRTDWGFCITPQNGALRLRLGCPFLCQTRVPIKQLRLTATERHDILLKTYKTM